MEKSDQEVTKGSNENEQVKSTTLANVENAAPQKLPYPKRVFFIIGNEFCERFNYYGMKTILVLYMNTKLGYSENDATVLYHVFNMFVYFMCIFGGIVSDVWLGKFNTILYLSIVYCIGSVVMSIGAIPVISFSPKIALYISLVLIAFGSGGIKPCVSAFGGDQFKMPEQAAQIVTYFSIFYFSINAGSLISTTITPMLRADVYCFGDNDCFPLAFGVPAILMVVALICFLIGKSSYTYTKTSEENMIIRMFKCISNAISTKYRERNTKPRENLLDYSIEKYGQQLVNETRIMSKIALLYLPVPFFWSLFDQQGSRWTFQANKMNGDLGFYIIKPDQMQMINPLLILVFIPLFEAFVYPVLNKIGLGRPLTRLTLGGILAGVAFLLSSFVEFAIESSPEKSVSMLWQIPQNVVITMGEVMFSVTGLSFSYNEAPESMKSIISAFWQLTVAFGNVIFVIIAEAQIFESQAYEFLLFSGLMFIDMLIFMYLAYNYKSAVPSPASDSKGNEKCEQTLPLNTIEEKSSN